MRKYLGTEDPETGELIPSSGKRGRKKDGEGSERKNKTNTTEYEELYKQKCKECDEKDALITKLERQNKKLKADLERDLQKNADDTGHAEHLEIKELISKAIKFRNDLLGKGKNNYPEGYVDRFNKKLDKLLDKE